MQYPKGVDAMPFLTIFLSGVGRDEVVMSVALLFYSFSHCGLLNFLFLIFPSLNL